jgi:hypothetical protein
VACCPAGHELAGAGRRRPCRRCRREAVAGLVAAAETSLPRPVIEAAVAAVAPSGQALSQLAAALAADPGALARGAPPVAGRLAAELITGGSKTLALPACARCGRAGIPLYRTPGGGMLQAVHRPPGHGGLRALRRGQAGRQPRLRRAADL